MVKIEDLMEELAKEKAKLDEALKEAKKDAMHWGQKYWYIPWIIIGFYGSVLVLWSTLVK